MNKKYKLDFHDTIEIKGGHTLYRIIALVDIGDNVKAGDKGGYIQSGKNLDYQLGCDCWVGDNAQVW